MVLLKIPFNYKYYFRHLQLFRNMRNCWAEVESLERQKRFREVLQ